MQVRPRSRIMPGAHHINHSAYISIYFKSNYIFSILVEKPVTQENNIQKFEYYEYAVDQGNPGFFDHIGGSDFYVDFHIPKEKLNSKEFSDRRQQLNKSNAYREVFSGEIDVSLINNVLNKGIELEGKFFTFGMLRVQFEELSFNSLAKESFSGIFTSGLKQLELGTCVDTMLIDLSSHDDNGQLGEGCILAIAEALESGSCAHIKKLTIDLSGYTLNLLSESLLKKALESPLCPTDVKFKITKTVDGKHTQDLIQIEPQTKNLLNLIPLLQFSKERELPLDILFNIICLLEINTKKDINDFIVINNDLYKSKISCELLEAGNIFDDNKFSITLFNKRRNIDKIALESQKLQNDLIQKIPNQVCKALDFSFNVGYESWLMISPKLLNNILVDVQNILGEILQNLTSAQSSILLRNGIDINQFALKVAGSIEKGQSFNVVTGDNIIISGLAGIYFSAIETQKVDLAASLCRYKMNMKSKNEVQIASTEELKVSKNKIKNQIILSIYKAIADQASPEQLEILVYDSNNENSKMMQLLKGNYEIQNMYNAYLIALRKERLMYEKSSFGMRK